MVLTCMIAVILGGEVVDTAATGKVKEDNVHTYVMDFSEYAKKQGYEGEYRYVIVDKDNCIEAKLK